MTTGCRPLPISSAVMAALLIAAAPGRPARAADPAAAGAVATADYFPILTYDTDVGLGYGGKAFVRGRLGGDESFDAIVFASSEGERWFRLAASAPDPEIRHGTVYPLAADLVLDYDRWLRASFFGIGNRSRSGDREFYTRAASDFSVTLGRAFAPRFGLDLSARLKSVVNSRLEPGGRLATLAPPSAGRATWFSLQLAPRYDSRDSVVDPTRGALVQAEVETTPSETNGARFTRLELSFREYTPVLRKRTVAALRLEVEQLWGRDLPVQCLLSLGGNRTLRGEPQDRYLDRALALANAELRFPLWRRLGGVAGVDAGKVWGSLADFDLERWVATPVVGLRYYLETFVVRLDVGFSSETTGVYFNFGHAF